MLTLGAGHVIDRQYGFPKPIREKMSWCFGSMIEINGGLKVHRGQMVCRVNVAFVIAAVCIQAPSSLTVTASATEGVI